MLKNISLIIGICFVLAEISQCNTSKPIVIAHRGASGYLPEHTLESKTAALVMGSDYLEQDVVLTKDHVPICLHDIFLDEVTDVAKKFPLKYREYKGEKRYFAADLSLTEIKTLQVSERFNHSDIEDSVFEYRFPLWQSAFQLHTLEEEIQLIKGYEKSYNQIHSLSEGIEFTNKSFGIYVEIKRPDFHSSNFSRIVLDIVGKYYTNARDSRVIIQCFDPTELLRIKDELKSEYTLIQLLEQDGRYDNGINYTYWNSMPGLQRIATYAQGVGPSIHSLVDTTLTKPVSSEFHRNLKNLKLLIHPWTFRADQVPAYFPSYNQLLEFCLNELKVDGFFTDFPDITLKFLNDNLGSNANGLRFNMITFLLGLSSFIFVTH